MDNNFEEWKDIIGYEGLYQVSNFGNIKSLEKIRFNGKNLKTLRIYPEKKIKSRISNVGYGLVSLSKNGKLKTFSVHRLVAFSFLGDIKGYVVNHIDGNKLNNNISNLEIISNRENNCHFSKSQKNKTSKFVGVSFFKKNKKWKSQISFNGKKIGLGYFLTEEEAYQKRQQFEEENNIKNKYI